MLEQLTQCAVCQGVHDHLGHCKLHEDGLAATNPASCVSAPAVLVATKNAAGEVRLALRRLEKRPEADLIFDAERRLVYGDELQELALETAPGDKSGFGRLPRRTIFTRHAKRIVREACAVMHEIYGRKTAFATGTLPGSTPEALRALACWSGYMNSRLNQWVRDTAPHATYAWVWELQGRGALHLHAVFGSHDLLELRRLERGFRDEWIRLLYAIADRAGVDVFARPGGETWRGINRMVKANCRPVRKNVAAYMSKYISKGSSLHAGESAFCPSRWWGISNSLRLEVQIRRALCASPVIPWLDAMDWFEGLAGPLADWGCPAFVYDNPWSAGDKTLVVCASEEQWRPMWTWLKATMDNLARRARTCAEVPTLSFPAYLAPLFGMETLPQMQLDCDLYAYADKVAQEFDGVHIGFRTRADDGGQCDETMNCCQGDDVAYLRVL